MIRISLIASLTMLASQASASAINWKPHRMGKPMPAVAIAGGASGSKVYYVCRKRMPQRWHTGYTFGARCHTARGNKELRHDQYQIATPGANSASLQWRNHNTMEKLSAIRSGKRPNNPALCRGKHQGRFGLIGHVVPRGCKAGHNNRSVVMSKYQVLTHPHAGNGKILAQTGSLKGAGDMNLSRDKKGPSGGLGAALGSSYKSNPMQFWSGVLRRAERNAKNLAANQKWGLRPFLGDLRRNVLPWNQLQKAFRAKHPNKRIFRNGTGQGRSLKTGAKFGQYDQTFVRFLVNAIPRRNPNSRANKPQAQLMKRVYDKALRPLARDFARVQHRLNRNATCRNRMMKVYKGLMQAKSYEPWKNFHAVMDPNYCNGRAAPKAGNKRMGQIALWWMRRYWDGTQNTWNAGLTKLMRNYDRDFLKKLRRQR